MSSNTEDPPKIDDTLSLPSIKTIRTTPLSPISSGGGNKKDIISINYAEGAVYTAPAEEDEECKTPTSVEHRIPQPLECPPAPRKPRLGKRKASSEFRVRFFEEVNRAEVENLFMRYERGGLINDSSSRQVVKRRRSSCNGFVVQFR